MDTKKVEIETGVILPDSGVIDIEWAKKQLARVDLFSASLLAYGRGEIFFMLQTNLTQSDYQEAVKALGFSTEHAQTYINYLQKRPVIEAIREKYYVALSLAASENIPETIEDALAICDIVVAKYGKITADNIKKALEDTGSTVKKMSNAAISIEKRKKEALHNWLLEEYQLSDDDILQASILHPEGLKEFTEKMTQAYYLLKDWNIFYNIIAPAVKQSDNPIALRFLSDLQDATPSMYEYLEAEKAHAKLSRLKDKFENEIYPQLNFEEEIFSSSL